MHIIIKEIENKLLKQEITRKVLKNLPMWFGIDEATEGYISEVINHPFIAAYIDKVPIGFYSVRKENDDVLDMYVLGVLQKFHGTGVGTALQNYVNTYAQKNDFKYLMVLTLAEKVQNKEYLLTRKFYVKQGFFDFYQNDDIFDKHNPCQIMIKKIGLGD